MENKWNLEYQYQKYLSRAGLEEMFMSPAQRQQLRMTFMAASWCMLDLLIDSAKEMEEERFYRCCDEVRGQLIDFFEGLRVNLN